MMWKALGWIREGQAEDETRIQKNWSKALVSRRLADTVWMDFPQSVFDFIRRDIRDADGFC